jgi:hypothetical protein
MRFDQSILFGILFLAIIFLAIPPIPVFIILGIAEFFKAEHLDLN